MFDIRLALMTGVDIALPQCNLVVHQPTLKEISLIGETDFFTGLSLLAVDKNKAETDLLNMTNFQIFMEVINDSRLRSQKEMVIRTLSLLFPNTQVVFLPKSILFNKEGNTQSIDDNIFEVFQEVLNQMFCLKGQGNQGFNPGGKKAKAIADKLMRARQQVAKEHGEGDASVFVSYMSCISVALQIPLNEISNYTLFQLYDTIERYGMYLGWDIDLRVRLAGGTPDEKQENWMRNIH